MAKTKKAKALLAVVKFGQRLMATVFKTVQNCFKQAFSITSSHGDAISDYEAWRDRFLWQRLHLALWIALI
ncbi:MAG: PAS domain-containing sensor histidine kinase, partial [Microcoleus sp. SIO2G3]|nr:PAS domain-containing sensor histidine kinase [Microcoleus sp. SIO2G3]